MADIESVPDGASNELDAFPSEKGIEKGSQSSSLPLESANEQSQSRSDSMALDPLHLNSPSAASKAASPRVRAFCKIKIEVGGQLFTTTRRTMAGCRLFRTLFAARCPHSESAAAPKSITATPRTNMLSFIDNPGPLTFEEFMVKHERKEKDDDDVDAEAEPPRIFEVDSNHFFVDRSPVHFGRILHFLRNAGTLSADAFLERYYPPTACGAAPSLLLELQDEVVFYGIPSLAEALEAKVAEEAEREVVGRPELSSTVTALGSPLLPNHSAYLSRSTLLDRSGWLSPNGPPSRSADTSWWDQSGPLLGLRRVAGTRIAFATAKDNWVGKEPLFEAPDGFRWATQSEYLSEYHRRRHLLRGNKEWVHFGCGGWDSYRWKYARKIAFLFKDSFRCKRFVHSGMEIGDINHVKSLFGLLADSPLMDYDDDKGIVEGFAGLVLLSDEVHLPPPPPSDHPADDGAAAGAVAVAADDTKGAAKAKEAATTATTAPAGQPTAGGAGGANGADDDEANDTEWTDDDDDELIQRLRALKGTAPGLAATPSAAQQNDPPPAMANPFAEVTRKRRAQLTQSNLQRHTQIESVRHSEQQQQPQYHRQFLLQRQHLVRGQAASPRLDSRFAPRFKPTLQASCSHKGAPNKFSAPPPIHPQLSRRHTSPVIQGQMQFEGATPPQPTQYVLSPQHIATGFAPPANGLVYSPQLRAQRVNGPNNAAPGGWDPATARRRGLVQQLSISSLPPPKTQ